MAAIQNLTEPWEAHDGDEVEAFLKAQLTELYGRAIGYYIVTPNADDSANVLCGFGTQDDYLEWNALSAEDKWGEAGLAYLLAQAVLPSAEGVDAYTVSISLQSVPEQIQPTNDVSINVKGTSRVIHAGGQGTEDIQETLLVQVQTRINTTVAWQTRGEFPIPANSLDYTTINLQPYLSDGTNYVRVRAVGEYASSIWRSISLNIVNLRLVPIMSPQLPVTDDSLSLLYLVGGAVDKKIQFEFGTGVGDEFIKLFPDANVDYDSECEQHIGESINTSTGMSFSFNNSSLLNGTNGILLDGVHTVRARLYASEQVKTDWVEYQYMVNRNESTTPMVVVNNVGRNLENWTEVKFFDWAAFTGSDSAMQVNFRLTNEDNTVDYLSWSFMAQNEVNNSFTAQLGIEFSDTSIVEFYGYMHIEDAEGNALADPVFYVFSNSASNQPTRGAELIISPSTRNNSETNPARVINAVDGQEIVRGNERSVFSGFGFVTDGWMEVNRDLDDLSENAEKVRVLRVPANRKLTIPYNPFKNFVNGNSQGRSVTLEIDFRTLNIVDETEPVFRIGTEISGGVWGFEMLATEAYLLTGQMRAVDDQNVSWAEDMRTRLTVNVISNYNQTGLNLVRIFLNGIIEREFFYSLNDNFTASSGVGIEIGNTSSDIDIFGIRCYQTALSSAEVMQDYKASLGTATEKVTFNEANDIRGQSDSISWSKCLGKYNIIGHTGHLPKYGDANKGKTKNVSIDIRIVGDDAHSGTIDHLEGSGQGTTAMTYYDWNQQYKITDESVFTPVSGEPGEAGKGYAIQDGEYLAKKLVGKINFASSMQSHKLGLTWIYNDLFKHLVGKNVISKPSQMNEYPNARITVFEKPFLFFHRETESDEYVFKYLMTFGAGKGDKPTFGFNKNTTPDMLMIEGANNDRPLALFRIPWNDDVTYDPDEEAWMYNGQKQLNFGFGKTSTDANDKEYPSSTNALNAQIAFFNFVYLHHSRVTPFIGTLTNLRESATADKTKLYWVTQAESGSAQYDLYRWDELYNGGRGRWVDAGVTKTGDGVYEKLNLRTQYETFCSELRNAGETAPAETWTQGQWTVTNTKIINVRRAHFRKFANNHVHVDDALYHSCFVKFYAGTDNRAKNTYYYTDPVDLKIRFEQDDLDTMIKTNNVGQNRKPYYVEEHDKNAANEFYWQGEESGFYNLLEEAFEDEMTIMMRNMLTGMSEMGGSVMGFHEQYFLSTQDYFPAFAYNEQARLVYENAAVAQNAGVYTNSSALAITQSVGSQRWSEYQWLKDRIMYISSWCEYGEFAGSSQAPNGLSWRGINGTYSFKLTPAKWLYPRVGSDSGNYPAGTDGSRRVRVPAGTQMTYRDITLSSDSWIAIRGINYFFDIGDMNIGLSSQQGTFTFTGKKLQKININPNGTDTNKFLATRIDISNSTNIKEFVVRNVASLSGDVNLTKCARIERIDLRGCGCSSISSSDNSALRYLYLPSSITSLTLVSPANLTDWSIDSTENLIELRIYGNSGGIGLALLGQCVTDNAPLTDLTLENDEWTNPDLSIVNFVSNIPNKNIKVRIRIVNQNFTFSLKQILMAAFGDIDDPNNDVWVDYVPVQLIGISLSGIDFMASVNFDYHLNVDPDPVNGNDFKQVVWSLDNNVNATINAATGVIRVIQPGTVQGGEQGTVTCTVTKMDNTVISASKIVKFYQRTLMLGDYVFSDGTYSPDVNGGGGRTAIGRCFYINPNNPLDRRMVSLGYVGNAPWGVNVAAGVTLADETVVSPDIPGVAAYGNGTTAMTNVPLDVFTDGRSGSYNATILIISTRNLILSGIETPLPIPEEQAASGGGKVMSYYLQDYQQASYRGAGLYYYPAASLCHAYEPLVAANENLDSKFTEGNWYLPSYSELNQISNVIAEITSNTWSYHEHTVYSNNTCAIAYPNGNYTNKGTSYNVFACCNF